MTDVMLYSVREFRHIAGRFLHARGCPRHLVNPLRDVLLAAQAEGFDALPALEEARDTISSVTGLVAPTADGAHSAGGQTAFAVAPTVIDLLAVAALDSAPVRLTIVDVRAPELFAHLREYARARGIDLTVRSIGENEITIEAAPAARWDATPTRESEGPAMARALAEGFATDVDRFWRLFHESNEALTPDSEVSRHHAGSQIYDADGNVIGEGDEESYTYIRSTGEQVGAR